MRPGTATACALGAVSLLFAAAAQGAPPVKKVDEGCAEITARAKQEPSASNAMAAGDCLRLAGKTAAARAAYDEARTLGRRAADEAEQRIRAIDEGQPKLLLLAPGPVAAGTSIHLDGVPIDPAAVGTAFPVQPGDHLVEVTRGASRWSARIEAQAGILRVPLPGPAGEVATAPSPVAETTPAPPAKPAIPSPAAEPAPVDGEAIPPKATPAEPPQPPRKMRWEAHRISGVALGGAGLVTVLVGAVYGVEALRARNASNAGPCNTDDVCDATGRSLRADAMRYGNVSTATLFAGGAAVASGIALFVTAPDTSPAPRVGLHAGPAGVRLVGRW